MEKKIYSLVTPLSLIPLSKQRMTLFSSAPLHSSGARKMEFLKRHRDISRPEAFFHPHITHLKVREGTNTMWERTTSKLCPTDWSWSEDCINHQGTAQTQVMTLSNKLFCRLQNTEPFREGLEASPVT